MMHMKYGRTLAIGALMLMLLGASPAMAASPQSHLSLTLNGAILDSGSQTYYHTGGNLVEAVIGGVPLSPSGSVFHYSLHAVVSELAVTGYANFSLAAVGKDGGQFFVQGSAPIDSMTPAESFPLGCTPGVDCTSGIPGLFSGTANVVVEECHGDYHSGHCSTLLQESVGMSFESAFLNPFGGPIFMASQDQAIFIVAGYTQSRVTWAGIQLGGAMSGSLAGSPVSGNFLMTVSATEDLRAGYELDHGTIAFVSGNPALVASGDF